MGFAFDTFGVQFQTTIYHAASCESHRLRAALQLGESSERMCEGSSDSAPHAFQAQSPRQRATMAGGLPSLSRPCFFLSLPRGAWRCMDSRRVHRPPTGGEWGGA